ncbi:MAG: hypothetical protein HFK09_02055 [Clostridia bacterium]|nr:hypothetical protein [Clostridia bacterium]
MDFEVDNNMSFACEKDADNKINYKNEFTYLAAYSLIKKVQATGEVDEIVLERLNNRCAERMGVRWIPL